jgi:hypothetical protein
LKGDALLAYQGLWHRRHVTTELAGASADDPEQPPAFIVIALTNPYTFCHPDRLMVTHGVRQHPSGASQHNRADAAWYGA